MSSCLLPLAFCLLPLASCLLSLISHLSSLISRARANYRALHVMEPAWSVFAAMH
jgi:hypothetical protein